MLIVIEILSVCFNLFYIYFAIKQKSIAWIFGFIASLLSFYLFSELRYFGSTFLNLVYALQGIFGFAQWHYFQKQRLPKLNLSLKQHFILMVSVVIAFLILSNIFDVYFPTTLRKIDLFLALGCILATFLEIRKEISCWYYWMVLNLSYTLLYSVQQLYLYAALMLMLGIFSFIGLKEWKKKLKPEF